MKVLGLDIGGAHLKASLIEKNNNKLSLLDIDSFETPLWKGTDCLSKKLKVLKKDWKIKKSTEVCCTMTGEMADIFENRKSGVKLILNNLKKNFCSDINAYSTKGFLEKSEIKKNNFFIASANWHATASLISRVIDECILIDIGSTTTDIIPIKNNKVLSPFYSNDSYRLRIGELVYLGVNRTPVSSIKNRFKFKGTYRNVMRELFANTSDVFRVTRQLDENFDFYPACDGKKKDVNASQQRLARIIGLDRHDASSEDWLKFANEISKQIIIEFNQNLKRVTNKNKLTISCPLVITGNGFFLAKEISKKTKRPFLLFPDILSKIIKIKKNQSSKINTCASALAVSILYSNDTF